MMEGKRVFKMPQVSPDREEYHRVLKMGQVSSEILNTHTNVKVVEASNLRVVLELPTGDLVYIYTDFIGEYMLEFFLEGKEK